MNRSHKLREEIRLNCIERPEGITALLSALEHGHIDGGVVQLDEACGCAYFHTEGHDAKRAIERINDMQKRFATRSSIITPLEEAVLYYRPGVKARNHDRMQELYNLILKIRDEVNAKRIASGLYDTHNDEQGKEAHA